MTKELAVEAKPKGVPVVGNYRVVDYTAQINFSDDEVEDESDNLNASNQFEDQERPTSTSHVAPNFQNVPGNQWRMTEQVPPLLFAKERIELPPADFGNDGDGEDEVMLAVERARRLRAMQQTAQPQVAENVQKQAKQIPTKSPGKSTKSVSQDSRGRRHGEDDNQQQLEAGSKHSDVNQRNRSTWDDRERKSEKNDKHRGDKKKSDSFYDNTVPERGTSSQAKHRQGNVSKGGSRPESSRRQNKQEWDEEVVTESNYWNDPSSRNQSGAHRGKTVSSQKQTRGNKYGDDKNKPPSHRASGETLPDVVPSGKEAEPSKTNRSNESRSDLSTVLSKAKQIVTSPRRRENISNRGTGRGSVNVGSGRGRDNGSFHRRDSDRVGELVGKPRRYTPSADSGSAARATSTDMNEQWETASETSVDNQQKGHRKVNDHSKDDSHYAVKEQRHRREKGNEGSSSFKKGGKIGDSRRSIEPDNKGGKPSSSRSPSDKHSVRNSGADSSSSRGRSGSCSTRREKPNPLKDIDLNNIAGVVNIDTITPAATSNVDDFVLGDDGETVIIDNGEGFQQVISKKEKRQSKKQPMVVESSKGGVAVAVSGQRPGYVSGQRASKTGPVQKQQASSRQKEVKATNKGKSKEQVEEPTEKNTGFHDYSSWDPASGHPLPPPLLGPSPKSGGKHQQQPNSALKQSSPVPERTSATGGIFQQDLRRKVTSPHVDEHDDEILGPTSQQLLCNISELTHLSAAVDETEVVCASKNSNTSGVVGESVWSSDTFAPTQGEQTQEQLTQAQTQQQFSFIYNHTSEASQQAQQTAQPGTKTEFNYWPSLSSAVSADTFVPSSSAITSTANADFGVRKPTDSQQQQYAPLQVNLPQASLSQTSLSPPRRPDKLPVSVAEQPQQQQQSMHLQLDQMANVRDFELQTIFIKYIFL